MSSQNPRRTLLIPLQRRLNQQNQAPPPVRACERWRINAFNVVSDADACRAIWEERKKSADADTLDAQFMSALSI